MKFLEKWNKPSRIFRVCAIGFCLGIALGQWAVLEDVWIWLLCLSLVAFIALLRHPHLRLVSCLLFLVSFAGWRSSLTLFAPSGISLGTSVAIRGVVGGEVEPHTDFQRVMLSGASVNGDQTPARILVDAGPYPILSTGQTISFTCPLAAPQPIQGFRYDLYLESRGVWGVCYRPSIVSIDAPAHFSVEAALLGTKSFLIDHIFHSIPPPASAFYSGLMFGGAWMLPKNLQTDFSTTGLSHVLAADGTKVALITSLFLGWAMQTFGRRRAIVMTACFLVAYVVMTGAVPSAVRAGLMAGTLLVGTWTNRRADSVNVLLLAVGLMLFQNPKILLADPGFQLSVSATAGMMLLAPAWDEHFKFLPKKFGLRTAFVASLAASVVTMPISLWHFGTISLISPLANFIALPFVPAYAALGIFVCLISIISPTLGSLLGILSKFAASDFFFVVQSLAQVPFAQISPNLAHLWAILSIIPIILLIWRRSGILWPT